MTNNHHSESKEERRSFLRPAVVPFGCPVLKRFALMIDGMTRASTLPHGPLLVYQLLYGSNTNIQLDPWKETVYYLALLHSLFVMGRWFGTFVSKYTNVAGSGNSTLVARL